MKVEHIFGGHIYLLSNFGVARNPIFKEQKDVDFFKDKMEHYLGNICEISAYAHHYNQFQYLVKIKERPILEAFYYKKQQAKEKNQGHNLYRIDSATPPDSYLIISQEVSNCLNSYVKYFNFKYKRKGSLFGDRYSKYLIESEEEMEAWVDKLNRLEKRVKFTRAWMVLDQAVFSNDHGEVSSMVYYSSEYGESKSLTSGEKVGFLNFTLWYKDKLRGNFKCLPPKSIRDPKFSEKLVYFIKINGYSPPW